MDGQSNAQNSHWLERYWPALIGLAIVDCGLIIGSVTGVWLVLWLLLLPAGGFFVSCFYRTSTFRDRLMPIGKMREQTKGTKSPSRRT